MDMQHGVRLYIDRGRYLSSVPDDALSERLVHLLNNCVKLDHKSMVQLCATDEPDMFMRLVDVFAETALRHGTVQAGQNKSDWDRSKNAMINPSAEVAEKAARLKSHIDDETQKMLFRFSSYEYIQELVQEGGVFLQSASVYKKQENISVRDDELELILTRYLRKSEAAEINKIILGSTAMNGTKTLEYSVTSPDFLTLCLTDAINYRMISDWNAEAAVIIHDPDEFYKRFSDASSGLHTSGQDVERGKVRYVDPYFDSYAKVQMEDLPFCKHFKFAYQREFRLVIRNSQDIRNESRKIFLGSLSDIVTLVDLR